MTPFTILWRFYNCSLITHCGIHSFNKYSPRPGSIDCSEIQWKLLAEPRHILGKTPFSQCASASQVIKDLSIHRWKSVHFELKPHSQKGTEYVEHNFADNPNQMEMTQWSSGRIIEGKERLLRILTPSTALQKGLRLDYCDWKANNKKYCAPTRAGK